MRQHKLLWLGVVAVCAVTGLAWYIRLAGSSVFLDQFIGKGALMKLGMMNANSKSLDTYGKVVDQHGDPVAEVCVEARVGLYVDFTHSGGKRYQAKTDGQGMFSFVGIHGAGTGFTLTKAGYEYNLRLPSASRPNDYVPDPANPLIFQMWKLKGPEPITFEHIHDYIPCDGNAVQYNLHTGKQVLVGGDLVVKLTRNPIDIVRGTHFDWNLTLTVPTGGLQAVHDAYTNEAPENGYLPSMTIDMPANMPDWSANLGRSFYIKSRNGQSYSLLSIRVTADFQPPPTAFFGEVFSNPAGSRNLEIDPAKEIKVP